MNQPQGALALAGALLLASCASSSKAQPLPLVASVSIDPMKDLGAVNRRLRGQNIEAGDTKGIFSAQTATEVIATGTGFWNPQTKAPENAPLKAFRETGSSMLRYPGGCLAHGFDWKKTIGPAASRGDWKFGLDEFLALCARAKVEPVITVPDYVGTPQDAADLVEYLNAPADARHPWARKRAKNGHPAPYAVRWFELGNESNHGNHDLLPRRQFSPSQYVAYALSTARAMKAVDASIQIGIVTAAGAPVADPWNAQVLKGAASVADFVVVHLYAVNWTSNDPNVDESRLMRACMAAGEGFDAMLGDYRTLIKAQTGRNIPIGLSEYNAGFVQDQPKPYRFSLGAALFASDFVRVLQQSHSNVAFANYWQFLNGYWGMVQGASVRPAFPMFALWGQHFGSRLIGVRAQSPAKAFEGFGDVGAESGATFQPPQKVGAPNLFDASSISAAPPANDSWTRGDDGTLRLKLSGAKSEIYPPLGTISRPIALDGRGVVYQLNCLVRWTPAPGSASTRLGLGLMDARGWEKTRSAVAFMGAQNAASWTALGGEFPSLPDASGATLLGRVEAGAGPVSGLLEVRGLKIEARTRATLPAYSLLTAIASQSSNKKVLYLLAWNKDESRPIRTSLSLPASWKAARVWSVSGPSFGTTTVGPDGVHELEGGAPLHPTQAGQWTYQFAPRSMTAIEWRQTGDTSSIPSNMKPITALALGAVLAAPIVPARAQTAPAIPKAPAAPTTPAKAINLLPNGDFAAGFDGWTRWNDGVDATTFALGTDAPQDQKVSVRIVAAPAPDKRRTFVQLIADPVEATPGQKLRLKLQMKARFDGDADPLAGAFATLEGVQGAAGVGTLALEPRLKTVKDWTLQTLDYTVPDGVTQVRVRVFACGAGTLDVADVSLSPLPAGTAK